MRPRLSWWRGGAGRPTRRPGLPWTRLHYSSQRCVNAEESLLGSYKKSCTIIVERGFCQCFKYVGVEEPPEAASGGEVAVHQREGLGRGTGLTGRAATHREGVWLPQLLECRLAVHHDRRSLKITPGRFGSPGRLAPRVPGGPSLLGAG